MPELMARVGALLRRSSITWPSACERAPPRLITIGDLRLNLDKRGMTVHSGELELTAIEFELLAFLAAQAGRAFTRHKLLKHVWVYEFGGYESTVNVHIKRMIV